MLRNVYFEGELGRDFLPHMKVQCDTVADIFRCLSANFDGVKQYFIEKEQKDIGYQIEIAGKKITDEREMLMEINEGDVVITPIPAGSGDLGKTIVGIIITVVGFILVNPKIIALGINLTLAGLEGLLAPDPSNDDEPDEESYLFQGAEQVITQGEPVPVLYGRLRVPGQPVGMELKGGTANYGFNTGSQIPNLQGSITGPVSEVAESDGSNHVDTPFPPPNNTALGQNVTEGVAQVTTGAPGRQSGGKR